MKVYIYALLDPRTEEVRYVGKSANVEERFRDHVSSYNLKRITHKNNWIRSLRELNLLPRLVVLEEVEDEDWEEAERRHIAMFRLMGCRLTNLTDGGEGNKGYVVSDETREKMRAAKRIRVSRGDAHWTRRFPERVPRGKDNYWAKHPERMKRGPEHPNYGKPDKTRGDIHWTRTNPEKVLRDENHPRAKLSHDQVLECRSRASTGEKVGILADEYGVGRTTMWHAIYGRTWETADRDANRPPCKKHLTREIRDEIRDLIREGLSQSKIAARFGINQASVSHIKNGKCWANDYR